jgi:hypothetical protein
MNDNNRTGYFPFGYYEDFLRFLKEKESLIKIITYDDLEWGDDYNFTGNYPDEWARWKSKLKCGEVDDSKIYVLIQHDVDVSPELTQNAIEAERKYDIRSNIMMFNRRVKRRHFQQTGELKFDSEGYVIDFEKWKKYEDEGFVFCYHANSFEQSGFNANKALEIFNQDVIDLRENFDIAYFSPHGGARSTNGESNNSLTIPEALQGSIRWVANGQTARFDGVYSDGGPNSINRDPSKRDLKDFVATWEPGKRYRVITHPQYYCDPWGKSDRLNEACWYREMQESYSSGKASYWADAHMQKKLLDGMSLAKNSSVKAAVSIDRHKDKPPNSILRSLSEKIKRRFK